MGKIETRKNDNGTLDLEITYGGPDAPFGGIDASAPPMYIDPKCFVNCSGFLIQDDKLIAVSWQSMGINITDWNALSEIFLGVGHFYASGQFWNWILSYSLGGGPGNPPIGIVTYNVRLWPAGFTGNLSIAANGTTLPLAQIPTTVPATPATAQIVVNGSTATVGGNIAITIGAAPVVNVMVNIGDTVTVVAANIVTAINAALGPATAIVDAGFTNRVDLTTTATGFAANSTALIIGVTIGGGGTIPLPIASTPFNGAMDSYLTNYGLPINPLSWTAVGESVYFGGPGTMILKLALDQNHPQLTPLTQYLGANVLGKFNGQLIAAGVTPGPGQVIQDSEMVIAWSAPEGEYGIWEPLFSDGTVTGAGFNQVEDISDYLTGIFINPGLAVLLRSEGIDYITPLSNGPTPFDFVHISNAKLGEGCQDPRLVTQYDQFGCFVGNSDIYEFSGSLIPIGKKIKNFLLNDARQQGAPSQAFRGSVSGPFLIDNNTDVYAHFLVGPSVFNYNFNNKTWVSQDLVTANTVFYIGQIAIIYNPDAPDAVGFVPALITFGPAQGPEFWQLSPGVSNASFQGSTSSFIEFPEEEIMFGRDITIDSALLNAAGTAGQEIHFDISATIQGTFTLPVGASPSIYQDYQIFFTDNPANDKCTVKNPQLTLSCDENLVGVINQVKIAKVALFGSFDPNQRPT